MEFDFPGLGKAFLAPAAVAAVVSWIFQTIAKGSVDNYFNQKLEQFKHDLGRLAASAQFDHQRKLRDFQAFRSKRHEAYAGVYEGARLVCHTLYREFSQFEFEVMCIRNESTNIPGSTGLVTLKRRYKELPNCGEYEQEFYEALTVEKDLELGLNVYRRAFVDSIGARAVGLIEEFERDCATKAVYLSDNVTEATRKLISQCYHLIAKTRSDPLPDDAFLALLDWLKKGMSDDLRIGDEVPPEQRPLEEELRWRLHHGEHHSVTDSVAASAVPGSAEPPGGDERDDRDRHDCRRGHEAHENVAEADHVAAHDLRMREDRDVQQARGNE